MKSVTKSDYEIIKEVGKGNYGSVYKAIRKSDGEIVALKVLYKLFPMQRYSTINEIDILKIISQDKCNSFLGCYYNHGYDPDTKELLIEMEYIDGQDLDKFGKKVRHNLSSDKLYYYLLLIIKDIATGLQFIHDKGVLHNDIKPENIIISTEMIPKLVDFGLSCHVEEYCSLKNNTICCENTGGTPLFTAPETAQDGIKYPASDVWSLGATIYNVATWNKYPFDFTNIYTLPRAMELIRTGKPIPLNTGNNLLDILVNQMINPDPVQRITVNEILEELKDY
jgi:serine/threonine protein kinase